MTTALVPTSQATGAEDQGAMPRWRKALVALGVTMMASVPYVLTAFDVARRSYDASFWAEVARLPMFLHLLAIGALLSGALAMIPKTLPQIISRAAWWQGLVMGALFMVLLCVSSSSTRAGEAFALVGLLAGGSGLALAAAGKARLDGQAAFAPVAFRFSLLSSLIMALADTQALVLYGGLNAYHTRSLGSMLSKGGPALACAAVMLIAIVGVYRMRFWGVALNIVANIAIAGLAFSGALNLPQPLAYGFAATAILQLLVPVPMLRAIVKNARR